DRHPRPRADRGDPGARDAAGRRAAGGTADGPRRTRAPGRLLPRDRGASPLDLVIGVMAFLAALALGASMVAERASAGWRAGLGDRLTVPILVPTQGDVQGTLAQETDSALAVLRATPGIVHAAPLS